MRQPVRHVVPLGVLALLGLGGCAHGDPWATEGPATPPSTIHTSEAPPSGTTPAPVDSPRPEKPAAKPRPTDGSMTAASKLATHILTADIEDGLFSVVAPTESEGDDDPEAEAFVDEALDNGLWVAQRAGEILVVAPHQSSYDRPLTVEQWDAAPPSDLDDWDDVCEASLEVTIRGARWMPLYDYEGTELPIQPGTYRVRISGKNFADIGDDDTDEWRIQFWAADKVTAPQRLLRATT